MSGTTPRMGLKTHDSSDPFLRQDFNDAWSTIDAYPGPFICTSGSRPAWGPEQAGMRIFETDTRRELMWTGTAWREVLSAPAVWPGFVGPNAAIGNNSHLYYRMATFTVHRPGSLAIWLSVDVQCQSTYTMNINIRPQVDGSDCHVGDSASHIRVERVHTSGGGWSRHYQVPALGLRTVGPGSHNFGIHFYTSPDSTTAGGVVRFTNARGIAMMVNSTDT